MSAWGWVAQRASEVRIGRAPIVIVRAANAYPGAPTLNWQAPIGVTSVHPQPEWMEGEEEAQHRLRVRVEIMGSQKRGVVGKSQ
jgi:hypothetical protein